MRCHAVRVGPSCQLPPSKKEQKDQAKDKYNCKLFHKVLESARGSLIYKLLGGERMHRAYREGAMFGDETYRQRVDKGHRCIRVSLNPHLALAPFIQLGPCLTPCLTLSRAH